MLWFSSPEFKVGALVVVVSGLIATMALRVAQGPGMFSGKKDYYFRADNAGGLVLNSAVKMAGIKIGVIEKIDLENGRAKIYIAVEHQVRVTNSAHVTLKSDGILGDKHVELLPGKDDDPELASGSEITTAAGTGGMDDVMEQVSHVAKNLDTLLDTLNRATKEGDDTTTVGRIVKNIEQITADLKQVTGENKDKVREILDRVKNIAKNVDTYINEESLARVDRSIKNIEDITTKINKGEGTLGRLINDDQTVDELNTAIHNVNEFLGGAQKMETAIDFHSEFMTNDENKSFLGLKIQPGLDRYYELDFISDSIGVKNQETDTTTTGGTSTTTDYTRVYKNQFKVTGLFAKNFWDFTLKGGIIENYGGVGVDYFPFGYKNLRLSTELYQFQALQWRAFARYNFFKGLYVVGGGDNLLSKDGRKSSAFVGAGLFITNEDLKILAAKLSFR